MAKKTRQAAPPVVQELPRWLAIITYRLDVGAFDVEKHLIAEIGDLHDLVESGPHWDTIANITVVRVNTDTPNLTIAQAEKL